MKQALGPAAVSQRDLQRVFTLLAFFIEHHNQRQDIMPTTVPESHDAIVHRSLLLSIAVAYYFRLTSALRQQFLATMGSLDATATQPEEGAVPSYDMAAVVESELNLFIQCAELPPGIAPNQALMENFYCIAICTETRTPLIIVGTPGTKSALHLVLGSCSTCV